MLTTDDYLKILETCAIKGHDDAIIRALRYIDLGYPIMLYSPPGNGKTTIAEHLLTYIGGGKDTFYEIEGTKGMNEYQIIGGFHPLSMSGNSALAEQFVYKHGIVTRAIFDHKNLLIDEFTRAPSSAYSGLFMLLSLGKLPLEYKETILTKPDGWVLIATTNFGDEGTYRLSNALKRRFVPIDISYPSSSTERTLLLSITPDLDEKVVEGILTFADETRAIWKKDRGIPQGLSTDGVIRMARYCELSMKQGSDHVSAFMDAAFHQSTIIADETDPHLMHRVQELVISVGDAL